MKKRHATKATTQAIEALHKHRAAIKRAVMIHPSARRDMK